MTSAVKHQGGAPSGRQRELLLRTTTQLLALPTRLAQAIAVDGAASFGGAGRATRGAGRRGGRRRVVLSRAKCHPAAAQGRVHQLIRERWVFAEARRRDQSAKLLYLAIVAHCVDIDPQNVPNSSRDPECGRLRTGRDHDREPRVRVVDFYGRHSPQQLAVERVQSRPRAALRSTLDLRVDGFIASVGHHIHKPCLGFRFPSLSLKPQAESRYDNIALVPLDFRPPGRHGRKSTPTLSRRSASRTPRAGPRRTRSRRRARVRPGP